MALPAYAVTDPSCKSLLSVVSSKELIISEKAIRHILDGEFSKDLEPKISGGLHSFAGLEKFLARRPDIFMLGETRIEADPKAGNFRRWYFHFEDPTTGVGYIRLPTSAYTAKALTALWAADTNATGGYLWKTLFPRDVSETELKAFLNQLYKHGERSESRGWAEVIDGDFFLPKANAAISIRMVVEKESGKLISAYPKMTQVKPSFLKSDLPIGRASIISERVYTIEDDADAKTRYYKVIQQFLNVEIHDPNSAAPVNFKFWNANELAKKQYLLGMFFPEGGSLHGSIARLEQIARNNFMEQGYVPGSLLLKAREIIEAVIRDPSIPDGSKLRLLADFVSNHVIGPDDTIRDVLWGKYLIGTFLKFSSQLSPGSQLYAMEILENSAIYWLLLMPYPKDFLNSEDVTLSLGRIASFLSLTPGIHKHDAFDGVNFEPFLKMQKGLENAEWLYFEMGDRIEKLSPGRISMSNGFRKLLVEFLNVHNQMASMAKYCESNSCGSIEIFGKSVSERNVRAPFNLRRTIRIFEAHSKLISTYLKAPDFDFKQWVNWLPNGVRIEDQKLVFPMLMANFDSDGNIKNLRGKTAHLSFRRQSK